MGVQACTRREALVRLGAIAGTPWMARWFPHGLALGRPSPYHPILSNQIYVWIQHFQSQKKTLAEGTEEALTAIHRAGFRRVELTADFLSRQLRANTLELLQKNDLELPTIYAGSTLHEPAAAEKSLREILELAQAMKDSGLSAIVTNPSPKPNPGRKSDEELNTQARYLNQLGAGLQAQGMRLMVHHHTPELAENAREWRHQLAHTDPNVVSCCVDVQWAHRGGQEPLSFLRAVGSRLASLHLRNTRSGVWMEDFNDGDIDYHKVADYLKGINYRGYLVVELAYEKGTTITRSLEEDLRLSRFYAEKVFELGSA